MRSEFAYYLGQFSFYSVIYIQSGITRFKRSEDGLKAAVITAEDEKKQDKGDH